MNQAIPKRRRKRLAPEPYQVLRREILKRDGWRCQSCGLRGDLQIHHIERKSYLGDDCEKNLITLCADCHRLAHRQLKPDAPIFP
jgi:5-methylcytosine-specific restriction endonuclease McrA